MRPERPLHTIQENEAFKKQAAQAVRDMFIGENSLFSPLSLSVFGSQKKTIVIGRDAPYVSNDKLNRSEKWSVIAKVSGDISEFIRIQKFESDDAQIKNIALGWVNDIFHKSNLDIQHWNKMTPAKLSALILNSPKYKEYEAFILANSEPQQVVKIVSTEKINNVANTSTTTTTGEATFISPASSTSVAELPEDPAQNTKERRRFVMPAIRKVALVVAGIAVSVGIYSSVFGGGIMRSVQNSISGAFSGGYNRTEQAVSPVATPTATKTTQPESPLATATPTKASQAESSNIDKAETREVLNGKVLELLGAKSFLDLNSTQAERLIRNIADPSLVNKLIGNYNGLNQNGPISGNEWLSNEFTSMDTGTLIRLVDNLKKNPIIGGEKNAAAEKEGVKVVEMKKNQPISEVLQKFGLFKDVKNWSSENAQSLMNQIVISNWSNPDFRAWVIKSSKEGSNLRSTLGIFDSEPMVKLVESRGVFKASLLSNINFAMRKDGTYNKYDVKSWADQLGLNTYNDSNASGSEVRTITVPIKGSIYKSVLDEKGRVTLVEVTN